MRFRANPVSGKLHWGKLGTKTRHIHPPATAQYMPLSQHCTPAVWLVDLYIYLLWSLHPARRQLACLLYKQATGYYMLQIGSDIKEQIQSAFKCTRIYYPIWKIIQASGAILIQRQWTGLINISKLDQLIISPKATLKSKLDTEGDFICSFLGCLRLGDLLQLFKRPEQPTLHSLSNQPQLCD